MAMNGQGAAQLLLEVHALKTNFNELQRQNMELTAKVEQNSAQLVQKDMEIKRLLRQITEIRKSEVHNEVEVVGIPERNGEDLVKITIALASKMGLKLTECDIESAQRALPLHLRRVSVMLDQPNPIAVQFACHRLRNKMLSLAAKAHQRGVHLTTHNVVSGAPTIVRVKERLSRLQEELLRETQTRLLAYDVMYNWICNGKIWVQKSTRHPSHVIETLADVSRYIGPPVDFSPPQTDYPADRK